jgi:recombination protein RecR
MARYPTAIEQLIAALTMLPGVGRKTAERYTFFLVKQSPETIERLVQNLQHAQSSIRLCRQCYNFTTQELCELCNDPQRDQATVCVVAEGMTLAALEQTGVYHGTYHVLGGYVNQLDGVGPDDLYLAELVERVQRVPVQELILATNPDVTGDATALYIIEAVRDLPVRVTKLARGLAAGSDIEYADDVTLSTALTDRKPARSTA